MINFSETSTETITIKNSKNLKHGIDYSSFCYISSDLERLLTLCFAFLSPRKMYFSDISLFLTFLFFSNVFCSVHLFNVKPKVDFH